MNTIYKPDDCFAPQNYSLESAFVSRTITDELLERMLKRNGIRKLTERDREFIRSKMGEWNSVEQEDRWSVRVCLWRLELDVKYYVENERRR